MLIIAGITIAVFFEFLLVGKRDKSTPDKILALWMFVITFHLFSYYLFATGEIYHYPFLLGLDMPLPLLHGVLLYYYVAAITDQLPARRWLLALHLLPAAATYLYLLGFFFLPPSEKVHVYQNRGAGYETFNAVKFGAIILSGIGYLVWCNVLLWRHRRHVLDHFSYRQKVDLRWLQLLVWGMVAIWVLVLFENEAVLFGGVAVFVFLIGFFGIRQARIFAHPVEAAVTPPSPPPPPATEEREKYAKSGLSDEMAERHHGELLRLMREERMFRRSDLCVDDLATKLKVHPNYLSQIINEKEGRNFYDFVNQFRIEEVTRRLAEPANRNLTLLSIAFDSGFNSKSSFNRHFKKVTGKTPSEYLASLTP